MASEKNTKEVIEVNTKSSQKSTIWSISSILSNIFNYVDRKDLIVFSTVCKKWNSVINPIIHKTIKLNCKTKLFFANSDNRDKRDAELIECISNISKHAKFVKEFRYNTKLEPQRAIEFFQTFRFISNLVIEYCDMGQDQFLYDQTINSPSRTYSQ
jgi:galactose-1-phosphate uridylyltransferase